MTSAEVLLPAASFSSRRLTARFEKRQRSFHCGLGTVHVGEANQISVAM
jgi:hypothetical protein